MNIAALGLAVAAATALIPLAYAADTTPGIRISTFGAQELRVEPLPRPSAGPGELLLRVHAAGVNPVDALVIAGDTRGFIDVELPHVPGYDVSGVVEAVGEGVDGFAPGDEAFALLHITRGGAYAGHARVLASEAAPKPGRLSHRQAAALPLVALTAWQAFEKAGLGAGQTVLIHGGAGGVGSTAVQIAKARGARVIATASASNLDFVRGLGADVVVDYRSERFEDVADGVDMVLDPIGGETQVRSLAVLKDGGTLVSLVGLGDAARTPPRGIRAVSILVQPDAAQLREVARLVEAGALQPEVSLVLPLADASKAHERLRAGGLRGKIVLEVLEADSE
jgi:NADPH:quinone reductase-like Zn-dependent oxidoreductase